MEVVQRLPEAERRPVESAGTVPVSQAQAGLWFETRLNPDSRHYNLLWEASIQGPMDEARFRSALDQLTARHPSMRTRFTEMEGEPSALVVPDGIVPCEFVDLRGKGLEAIEAWRERESQWLAGHALDLGVGPLFGFRVARVGESRHLLLMLAHHIVADGYSWPLILRELVTCLGGAELTAQTATPAQVAAWQQQFIASDAGRRAERYWREMFPQAPAMSELPGQRERPAVLHHAGALRTSVLPAVLMERVRACAVAQGATVFRTLLAGFAAVLHRWTGDAEVVIGTTFLGRSMPGAESVVGFLNNVAAVRVAVEPGITFSALIRAVHAAVSAAVHHQEFPFSQLAATWKGTRASNRIGWTSVSFTKLPERIVERRGEFEVEERRVFLDRSPHELAFYVQENGNQVDVFCEFNPVLYPPEVIARWLSQYTRLLEAATILPDDAVMAHSLRGPEDEHLLPNPFLALDTPRYPTVTDALCRQWSEGPGRTAIRQLGREWNYGDLKHASGQIAAEVIRLGLPAGSVVAVLGPRSFGLIAGMVAVWRAGCQVLTLDLQLPVERRRVMIQEAGVSGLIVVQNTGADVASTPVDTDPGLPVVEVLPDGEFPRQGACGNGEDMPRDRQPPGEAAYLFFTSGTTGVPKAVRGSHSGLGHFLAWQRTTFGVGPGDRAAQLTGLSFDVVLRDIFTPLTAGATLCLPGTAEGLLGGPLLEWLEEEQVTLLHVVPSLAQAWLEQAPEAKSRNALRLTFFAGEPLTAALVHRWRQTFPSTRILNLYGPTETTLAKCFHEVLGEPDPGIQPVGRPQPETQAWVLNEAGVRCGIGEPGEIVIRTPFRSLGYANSPEETARKFQPNPFREDPFDQVYFTGDRGRFRADGALEILGRKDSQVKIRGVRIELNEVTAALAAHPEVLSAVVIAREDEPGRKFLAGYVVPRAEGGDLASTLMSHLRRLLPAAFVPEAIVVLKALPLTPNGKVDRKALPAPLRPLRTTTVAEPRTLTERQVTDLMRELLKDGNLGPEDNFFEAGGHSLLALQWLAGIRKLLGVEVSLRILFERPTAAAVARAVEEQQARGPSRQWRSLTPLNLGVAGRPGLFVFTGGNGGDRELYVHSYLAQKWLGGKRPVYGLRMRGWDGAVPPHDDIQNMARDYMEEIRSVQPKGPYSFFGDCTGGNIAFETAVQLQAQGEEVPFLLLADCIYPRLFEYERFLMREGWRRWNGGPWLGRLRRWLSRPGRNEGRTPTVPSEAEGEPTVDAPDGEYWTDRGRHYRRVITRYRPGKYRGRLRLVVSQGRRQDKRIVQWQKCATEGATITELPDNHWLYLWHHGDRIQQWLEASERREE
jgi:amino acid adenylation domain-containing protein